MNETTSLPPEQNLGGGEAAPETEAQRAERMAIIEAFSAQIKEKRKNAIEARRASGIEDIWAEDEAHYDGEDDPKKNGMTKGRTSTDGLTEAKRERTTRSTAFLKITRPYVDATAARLADMLLPTDDRNFEIKPTPKPELTKMLQDMSPANGPAPEQPPQAQPGMVARIKSMFAPGQGVPPTAAPQPTVASQAKAAIDKAKASAERAQEEIDDWLVECRYHAEVRKVIESAAKVGSGILKGPQPAIKRSRAAKETPQGWTVEIVQNLNPTSRWINHWNFYPDGACGDNIQRGSYTFECDDITARGLLDLKADPTYLADAINECIDEGPCDVVDGTRKNKPDQKTVEKDLFQIWYFHGQVSKADMEAAGCSCKDKDSYPAIVTMVNDRVIKVTLSPLDSGEYPYDVMVWQARTDHWAGTGVARQMRECQKGVNAAVRNLMDNAGLAAGPMFIMDRSKLIPANKKWEVAPRKFFWTNAEEDVEDVRKAFEIITIPDMQEQLLGLVNFWTGKAEEVTGLPMLLQGQQGEANPTDKVGIATIMNNNGSTVLRRIARTFDDRVTEPHIGRYYEYLLLYGPDDAKGDFQINARGSSALVERDQHAQMMPHLIGLSVNPIFELDPANLMKEWLKSLRMDVGSLELSDEKKAEMANRQPPEDPRITAAKIMAKLGEDKLVAGVQTEKMKITESAKEAEADRQVQLVITHSTEYIEQMKQQGASAETVAQLKAMLAATAMKLRTQTDLSLGAHAIDLHKHFNPSPQVITPGAEPAGRAPAGEAFAK